MANITEEINELGADLLLKAAIALSSISVDVAKLVNSVGKNTLAEVKENMAQEENEALKKIQAAVEKDGETPLQVTVLERDRELMEMWLNKQDVLYATLKADSQNVDPGFEKCVIAFLGKDAEAMSNAIALTQHERGLINELPPNTFLFLHKNKNMVVIDNLNVYDLEVFRELAKDYGLVYSSILNPPDSNPNEKGNSYKILVHKQDANRATAIMQQVVWGMTGEYEGGIKERIKERLSIRSEVQQLIEKGVEPGTVKVKSDKGEMLELENAWYIVNQKAPHQYIKMTSKGFVHFKFDKEVESVSKSDSGYYDKLQNALGDFSGAVIYNAEEWELNGLGKGNLRDKHTSKKASVFPEGFSKTKDITELQKARKKKDEPQKDDYEETAWLFDRYDAHKEFSEVYEVNYENSSEPPEKTVSVHYDNACQRAEAYKYIDVSNDAKTIDNIILAAREHSLGNKEYRIEDEKTI